LRKLIEPWNTQESCNFKPYTIKRSRETMLGEIPSVFVLAALKNLQHKSNRRDNQEISYIRSPTPANKCEGEYIEVSYKNISGIESSERKISSYTRTWLVDEK